MITGKRNDGECGSRTSTPRHPPTVRLPTEVDGDFMTWGYVKCAGRDQGSHRARA
jgi:hypothetical protein